jgi:putative ABC transport system ATP-binding protein
MAIFNRLNEEGNTIIMVTHEAEVSEHAKRVLHIRDGLIERDVMQNGNGGVAAE